MFKKLIAWLLLGTQKVEPYTPAELGVKRVERLAEALRQLPPALRNGEVITVKKVSLSVAKAATRRGTIIPHERLPEGYVQADLGGPFPVHHITTYNHPDLLEITTQADVALGMRVYIDPNQPTRGSNES